MTLRAPPAPEAITTSTAVKGRPVSRARRSATAVRVSTRPCVGHVAVHARNGVAGEALERLGELGGRLQNGIAEGEVEDLVLPVAPLHLQAQLEHAADPGRCLQGTLDANRYSHDNPSFRQVPRRGNRPIIADGGRGFYGAGVAGADVR